VVCLLVGAHFSVFFSGVSWVDCGGTLALVFGSFSLGSLKDHLVLFLLGTSLAANLLGTNRTRRLGKGRVNVGPEKSLVFCRESSSSALLEHSLVHRSPMCPFARAGLSRVLRLLMGRRELGIQSLLRWPSARPDFSPLLHCQMCTVQLLLRFLLTLSAKSLCPSPL
jgi:hypothetical protein